VKNLTAILLLLYSETVIPEQLKFEWWWQGVFGAPCSTATDRIEGTCNLEVKRRPTWATQTTSFTTK
jgi:hypothetical protein